MFGNDGAFDGFQGGGGDDKIDGGEGALDFVGYPNSTGKLRVDLAKGKSSGKNDGTDRLRLIEMVDGSPHDDTLLGDAKTNVFFGGEGDDNLGGRGGDDIAEFSFAKSPLEIDLGTGQAEGEGADKLAGFESAVGGPLNDAIAGDEKANHIIGAEGDDEIVASGGSDAVSGDVGDDYVDGGEGDDVVAGDGGDDQLVGGPDSDTACYASADVNVVADIEIGGAIGQGTDLFSGIENLEGSPQGDDLAGDEAANHLRGEGGGDILSGFGANDALAGGDGSDDLDGGEGDDSLLGETGANAFTGGGGTDVCFNEVQAAQAAPTCETGAGGTPDELPSGAAPPDPPGASARVSLTSGAARREFATSRFVGWSDYVSCGFGQFTVFGPNNAQRTRASGEAIAWTSILWRWLPAQGRWATPQYGSPWLTGNLYAKTFSSFVGEGMVAAPPYSQGWTIPSDALRSR